LRWGERLLEWFRHTLPDRVQRPHERQIPVSVESFSPTLPPGEIASLKKTYLFRLRERAQAFYIYGLDERRRVVQQAGHTLDPVAIYQPLYTSIRVPVASEPETERERVLVQEPETRPLTLLEVVGQEPRVMVLGSHGTGKSMFLRYLALSLIEHREGKELKVSAEPYPDWMHGALFPLWIDLAEFASSEFEQETAEGLCAFIAHHLDIFADQLWNQVLAPGGVLLLLDGLEWAPEATSAFLRCLDAAWLDQSSHGSSCVVVTSQPYVDADRSPAKFLPNYVRVVLEPWDLDQLDSFVRSWYAELQRREWLDAESARDLPGRLCSALRRDRVHSIASRPSLMTLIALLHTLDGRLPIDDGLFLHELIELAFATWSEGREEGERDLGQLFDVQGLRSAISALTFQGYSRLADQEGPVEFSESDIRAALVHVSRDGRWEAVHDMARRMMMRPYLLDERAAGVYTFIDLNLQAYAAARHLSIQPDLPALIVGLAMDCPNRWRRVILFTLSRLAAVQEDLPGALEVVEALIEPWSLASDQELSSQGIWRLVWLAGEALIQLDASCDLWSAAQTLESVQGALTDLLQRGRLDPAQRSRVGQILDRLPGGDPRSGVTLAAPLWCQVPESAFWFGEDEEAEIVELDTFWISRYPVTNAQYAVFVGATSHKAPSHWHGSHPPPGLGNHPVVHVTWDDVSAYCAWWNARLPGAQFNLWSPQEQPAAQPIPRDGQFRLPSSAEWEKASRGGLVIPRRTGGALVDNPLPRRRYPWGDSWALSTMQAEGDERRCNVAESNLGTTTPVGMYPDGASPYGVMDVAGNVWEWCQDWADTEHRYKIRRGGAFRYSHEHARCSAFDRSHPNLAWPYVGFRVVLGPRTAEQES
jgi:formylglycine-generating enzyme required for sulfatase activity/SAM-dependent methyltransferase